MNQVRKRGWAMESAMSDSMVLTFTTSAGIEGVDRAAHST